MGMGMSIGSIPAPQQLPTASNSRGGGLPPGSTLLTPLPGYEPPAVISGMQGDQELGYEVYDRYGRVYESDGRPGTGHASLGGASADGEYDT
jgi:transcription factor CON7